MITEEQIESSLLEVDENKLMDCLRDEECFHTSLVTAIVAHAAFGGPKESLLAALQCCINTVKDQQEKMAEKIAFDKDCASRFQADMKDKFE